ncbi:MAG: hypothetical protein ABEJ30_01270 [Halorientalis sp.]
MDSWRRLRRDERASAPADAMTGPGPLFVLLVVAVLVVPPVVAVVGALFNRDHAFEYVVTAAASLVAAFTLTGVEQFGDPWAAVGHLAVVLAIARHLWAVRRDAVDVVVVVAGIYLMPLALAVALLLRRLA